MNFDEKECSFCGKIIKANAQKCRFCGHWLNEIEPEKQLESPETKLCPYCGEEILSSATKCKHCKSWLNGNNESVNNNLYSSSNNGYTSTTNNNSPEIDSQAVLGWIFIIGIIIWYFSSSSNNYTPKNWLKGCEEGKEKMASNGAIYKEYKCKNKPYTNVIEASLITLGWNSAYSVYDNNQSIGYINYDYNFKQYTCAYIWDKEETTCNLKEFVSNLKKYEEYKKRN